MNYSLYVPAILQNVPNYQADQRRDMFLGAAGHRGSFSGSVKPWKWLSISPTVVVEGPKLSSAQNEADGTQVFRQLPAQALLNLVARIEDVPVEGLSISLGIYNVLGTSFHYPVPYTSTSHGALPGLDREVLLKATCGNRSPKVFRTPTRRRPSHRPARAGSRSPHLACTVKFGSTTGWSEWRRRWSMTCRLAR